MHKDNLLILDHDKEYARQRIATLQKEIEALGPEFNDAFSQTSETWHDNAPFEIVRDKQAVLYAEQQGLRDILRASLPSVPQQEVSTAGIGALVEVASKNGKIQSYFIAGDWTPFAGKQLPGTEAIIVSREAPITKLFLGLKEGDTFAFNHKKCRITRIDYGFLDAYAKLAS